MDLSLSLDIGTRKVVGLVTAPRPRGLHIVAAERMEHPTRAMYDGQVHDVAAVAEVVAAVKARLEARLGLPLREAAVAAAGRALRTCRGTAERVRAARDPIDAEEAFALELEAIQDAQRALAAALSDQVEAHDYLYVGHSVLSRRLDGLPMTALVGQRGREVAVEVVATFLPRVVVDSLAAVLERVGLEMTALTLEPIAAIGAVVPPTMRHLHLALVDVGAGTSDIAVTRQGTVVGYDMVPVAGDEITEALSAAFLLDFPVAEAVKRQIGQQEELTFTDILGHRHRVPAAEVVAALQPAVAELAAQVAGRILQLGGEPPQAVMLVGGGSRTPGLAEALARALGLPLSRVAVRGREAIQGVTGARKLLDGPDAVTPIGIAIAVRDQAALGFTYVHVEGKGVRLFHPSRRTVADALLAAGYRMRELLPRLGPGLTVTVNGELRLIPGTSGRPAEIRVNGQPATLTSPVHHRDQIAVTPAVPGEPGRARVADVLPPLTPLTVTLNGEVRPVPPVVTVNGQPAGLDQELRDNDAVEVRLPRTLAEVLASLGVPEAGARPAPVVRVRVAGRWVELPRPLQVLRNGRPAALDEPVHDGDVLEVHGAGAPPPIVAEALAQAGFRPDPPAGKSRLQITVGGRPADLTTPLTDGDEVDLVWT